MRKRKPSPVSGFPDRLNVASPEFFGVLAVWGRCRVAVHASGSAYLVQYADDDGVWRTDGKAPDAEILPLRLVYENVLQEAVKLLPLDPSDAVQGLRMKDFPLTKAQMSAAAREAGVAG